MVIFETCSFQKADREEKIEEFQKNFWSTASDT